uniref:Uncharacterized protein n=1 Tax=Mandrillus leucophaeus TaxID=9568 RepID=A0A2K6A7K5_MANLE
MMADLSLPLSHRITLLPGDSCSRSLVLGEYREVPAVTLTIPEPILWESSLTSPAPSTNQAGPGCNFAGLSQDHRQRIQPPGAWAFAGSPSVPWSLASSRAALLSALLCVSSPHSLGSLSDLFGLSHAPTGLYSREGALVL